MKPHYTILALFFVSTQTFAMFCPNGFNQINIGDSIASVTQQCGNPDAQKTDKMVENQPQEWDYYVKPDPTQPTTLKMAVAFDSSKKVVNITVNGTSLVSTTICGSAPIQLGDTSNAIKSACGKPAFTNQGQPPTGSSSSTEVTSFKYNSQPPTTLIFENGLLKERQQ